jgi:hypothetical protein
MAAENQPCRSFLNLLHAQERIRSSPRHPKVFTHFRWTRTSSGPGFPRFPSTGSFSKPSPAPHALQSRTHTSATLEPQSAIFTGSQKRGPRSASRGVWWGRPSKETTSAGQAIVSLYTPLPLIYLPHSVPGPLSIP